MGVLGYAVLGYTVLGQPDWVTGATVVPNALPGGSTGHRFTPGYVVHLQFKVSDADGALATPGGQSLLVRHESGYQDDLTADLTNPATGTYRVDYSPALTGRYEAAFVATGDYAGRVTVIFDVDKVALAFITLTDLRAYLGATSATDDDLTAALHAERTAQAQRCRIDPYNPALREALMRRVAVNLAARSVPVASFSSFDGGVTTTRAPGRDPVVARLEAPYRKLVCG